MTEADPSPQNAPDLLPGDDPVVRVRPDRLRSSRRWLVVLGVLIAFVLLEAALQIAAYAMYLRGDRASRPESSGDVLCIGDSFTFGLGASDPSHSYPEQLSALLAARGIDLVISNAGRPGRNSKEVLAQLGRHLDERRPRLVYLLVGTNDRWSRPARLEEDAELRFGREGFTWCLRSLRLLQLVTNRSEESSVADRADAPFVGSWQIGPYGVTFEADGRLLVGGTPLSWSVDDQGIHVRTAADNQFVMSWSLGGDVLRLESPLWPSPVEMTRGLPVADLEVARAREFVEAGDDEGAMRLVRKSVEARPPAPIASEILVSCLVRAGRMDESAGEVARLRASFDETTDATTGDVLLRLYLGAGERDLAEDIARTLSGAAPGSAELMRFALSSPPDRQDSVLAVARTAAKAARAAGSKPLQAIWLRTEADVVRASSPAASLRAVVSAFAVDGDEVASLHYLRRAQRDLGEAEMLAIARQCEVAESVRDQVLVWIEGLRAKANDPDGVLRDHLARAVRLAKRYDAQVVLLSYPRGEASHATIAASVAEDEGCGWLDVRPRFTAALKEHPVAEVFIPDGHCADLGYAILAAAVAEDVVARLMDPKEGKER